MVKSRLNDIEIARSYYEYTTTEYSINDIVNKYKIGKILSSSECRLGQ